ncbi:hypothetical protein [Bacterioplanoides sp.]|uniref:hypothetical protein n=1 Tax=Bacterioplanoides sp. TaxID=2066072 RepID=UPI003B00CEFF
MSKKRVLFVDADIPAFRACQIALESIIENGVITHFAQEAIQNKFFDEYIADLKEKTKIDKVVVCLSSGLGNFRKELNPDYKENRTGLKPVGYPFMVDYIRDNYDVLTLPFLEADDTLGIYGSLGTYKGREVVIASEDKDLLTIPNYYCDIKDGCKIKFMTDLEADEMFLTQTLTGDTTDGYKGCPSYGPKTAAKLFAKCEDEWDGEDENDLRKLWWDAITSAFVSKDLTADDALLNARMARILRHTDYDMEAQRVIHWTPDDFE